MRKNQIVTKSIFFAILSLFVHKQSFGTIADFYYFGNSYADSFVFQQSTITPYKIIAFNWDFDNDSLFNDGVGDSISHKFKIPGSYLVGLQVITDKDTASFYKEVLVSSLGADFKYNGVCKGDSTTLINTTTFYESDSILYVHWDFNDDSIFNEATGNKIRHLFSGYDTVRIGIEVGSRYDTIWMYKKIIFSELIANFHSGNGCAKSLFKLNNTTVIYKDSIVNFIWDFGDGSRGVVWGDPVHVYEVEGLKSVKLKAISSKGCKDSITKTIEIFKPPVFDLILDGSATFYQGESTIASILPHSYDSIIWSTGQIAEEIEVIKSCNLNVKVVDGNNCSSEKDTIILVLEKAPLEPMTLITPNGDGYNDLWEVAKAEPFKPIQVKVFNQWGKELYYSNNYNNDWDGRFKGSRLPNGSYFFIIKGQGMKTFNGTLTILN